jgi:hypothetical protein
MDAWLGAGNTAGDYVAVLAVYAGLFLLMRQAVRRLEPGFRRTFGVLGLGWACSVFVGNYVFYRLGWMSFLPWVNNLLHTFLWIGLCLGYLYSDAHKKPLFEQVVLFILYSFLVKVAERALLGTWEKPSFFGLGGNFTYLAGWSLLDGLYPLISLFGLRLLSRVIAGLVVPGSPPRDREPPIFTPPRTALP